MSLFEQSIFFSQEFLISSSDLVGDLFQVGNSKNKEKFQANHQIKVRVLKQRRAQDTFYFSHQKKADLLI